LILAGEYKDHKAIAAVSGLDVRYVRLILPCAFLAPEIVEAIVKGHQGAEMTLAALVDDVPLSWAAQHAKMNQLPRSRIFQLVLAQFCWAGHVPVSLIETGTKSAGHSNAPRLQLCL
jgi:hypothetical protein